MYIHICKHEYTCAYAHLQIHVHLYIYENKKIYIYKNTKEVIKIPSLDKKYEPSEPINEEKEIQHSFKTNLPPVHCTFSFICLSEALVELFNLLFSEKV